MHNMVISDRTKRLDQARNRAKRLADAMWELRHNPKMADYRAKPSYKKVKKPKTHRYYED